MKKMFLFSKSTLLIIALAFASIISSAYSLKAQDTIVNRNDEKIIATILEVNPTEIKYKRFDYQTGPVFATFKWELKYIIYGNGVKESFENYSPPVATVAKLDLSIQPTGKYYYYRSQKIAEQDMLDVLKKQKDPKVASAVIKTEKIKFTKNCFRYGGMVIGTSGILEAVGVFSAIGLQKSTSTNTYGGRSGRAAQRAARSERQKTGGYLFLGGLTCELIGFTFNIEERKFAHIAVDLYNKTLIP